MGDNSVLLRRLGSLPILLALFYIILLTPLMGRKNGYTVDATPSFQLTKTIVISGDWFPDNLKVKQGYLYSIAYIPFYVLGDTLAALNPTVEADWIRRKCLCWMNTVITGGTLALLSLLIGRLRFSRLAQTLIPLAYGLSTMAFNYARYDYNKSLAGLLLLSAFYSAISFIENVSVGKKQNRWIILCGISMTLLMAIRVEMAIVAPIFFLGFICAQGSSSEKVQRGIFFSLFCLAGIAWVLFYNRLYWGSDIAGGYEGGFQANPFPGLMGFLFSPGKNIWVFNPILLLLPLSLRTFRNQRPQAFSLWMGTVLLVFALYCLWGNWWGGWGWGPRHLVPLLPLLILPLAVVVDQGSSSYRLLFGALFLTGFAFQFLGAIIDFNDVILALMRSQVTEPELIWNPVWNAILQHGMFFGHMTIDRWDIGWMGLKNSLSFPVFLSMLCVWIGLLAGIGYWIVRLMQEPSRNPS